ncbi:MAG: hypothetical protein K9N46_07635 [Candidatus Marinimicrobia bacterium]|nr:hypothetical protein [Candidatus Neomarinimicrobiota bacterium]MCF7880595.1 hypothetical protein [Candidatus Neomarinimicrobiota bacterium]
MARRSIPTMIAFFFGAMMVINYFVPWGWFSDRANQVQEWGLIVVAFAYILGALNVMRVHGHKVQRKDEDWRFSIVTIITMIVMLTFGLLPEAWGIGGMEKGSPFLWMFDNMYVPMMATMYSLLAFFIASAAFRAFKVRSLEATLLAVTAVIVMIGAVPLGGILLPGSMELRTWIMETLQNVGKRGIMIGVALGAISTSLKIILGIERPYGRD